MVLGFCHYLSNFSVRFSCLKNGSDHNTAVWATTSTIIPQTPGPQYTGPKKPAPKSTPVHYHYDVSPKEADKRTIFAVKVAIVSV